MLKKYHVSVPFHCSINVEVEAKSVKDAMEKALDQAWPSLCSQCDGPHEIYEMNDGAFTEACVSEADED